MNDYQCDLELLLLVGLASPGDECVARLGHQRAGEQSALMLGSVIIIIIVIIITTSSPGNVERRPLSAQVQGSGSRKNAAHTALLPAGNACTVEIYLCIN